MNWNRIVLIAFLWLYPSNCIAKTAQLSDFWFLRGNWELRKNFNQLIEEKWTKINDYTLEGNTIFKKINEKAEYKPTLIENMRIHLNPNRTFLSIKHFDGDMKPWAESEEPGDLDLIEIDMTHAVFENKLKDNYVKITYTWLADNALRAHVETKVKGKSSEYLFDYEKMKSVCESNKPKALPITLYEKPRFLYSGGFDLDQPIKPIRVGK